MKRILENLLLYSTLIGTWGTIFAIHHLFESHMTLVIALIVIDIVLLAVHAHVFKNKEDHFWYL